MCQLPFLVTYGFSRKIFAPYPWVCSITITVKLKYPEKVSLFNVEKWSRVKKSCDIYELEYQFWDIDTEIKSEMFFKHWIVLFYNWTGLYEMVTNNVYRRIKDICIIENVSFKTLSFYWIQYKEYVSIPGWPT